MNLNLEKCCNNDTSSRARSFLKLLDFDFVTSLIITRHVFDMTLDVTVLLQSKSNDICDGIHLIKSMKSMVNQVRKNVDHYHKKWYKQVLNVSKQIGLDEKMPRICPRQTNRSNHNVSNVCDYFKVSVTIPLLDYLCLELDSRF